MVGPTNSPAADGVSPAASLPALRRRMRLARRQLPHDERLAAGAALARQLATLPAFQRARRVAGYWPADGEINPLPALLRAIAAGKACYLPILSPQRPGRLQFARWWPGAPLRYNRFGIPEPGVLKRDWLDPRMLDLVILPLVAFDGSGNRLGMGGGFYDRSFAFLLNHAWRRPRLVGAAFDLQRLASLPRRPWDIPLDAVVSEQRVRAFTPL